MADRHLVERSINKDGAQICVDLFRRPNGTYGFEEYRRDPEDLSGWRPIGHFGDMTFDSQAAALAEARRRIPWLAAALD